MSKKETVRKPWEEFASNQTTPETSTERKPWEEFASTETTSPGEEPVKKKDDTIPSISGSQLEKVAGPSPSAAEDGTSQLEGGSLGAPLSYDVNPDLNPKGIIGNAPAQPGAPTNPFLEQAKKLTERVNTPEVTIPVETQGLSSVTSSQTAGDVNTTGGNDFDTQTSVGKSMNKVLGSKDMTRASATMANMAASISRAPAYASDLVNRTLNTVVPYLNLPSDAAKMNNPVASFFEDVAKRKNEEVEKRYAEEGLDKDITDYLDPTGKDFDINKGFSKMRVEAVGSMPYSIAVATGAGAGLSSTELAGISTAAFGAEEKQALLESNKENEARGLPTLTDEQINNVSAVSGAINGVGESLFGNVKFGNMYKKLLTETAKKESREAVERQINTGVKNTLKDVFKDYAGIVSEEAITEGAQRLLENLNNKYIKGDDSVKVMDGVMNDILVGAFSAGAMGGPGFALSTARQLSDVKQAEQLQKNREAISNEIKNPLIPEDAKRVLKDRINKLNEEEDAHVKEMQEKHNSLPDNKKEEVDNILKESHKMAEVATNPDLSDEAREAIKDQIAKNDAKVDEIYKENEKLLKEKEKEKGKSEEKPKLVNQSGVPIEEKGLTEDEQKDFDYLSEIKKNLPLNEEEQKRFDELGKKQYVPEKITTEELTQTKNKENAIQEQSASSLLQHTQEGTGETRSERGGVEQGQQGQEITAESEGEKEKVASEVEKLRAERERKREGTGVYVAPFYDTQVKSLSEAKEVESSPAYKTHVQTIHKVAEALGLKIKSTTANVGKYTNDSGEEIMEVSTLVDMDTDDLDKATEFAAVMGAMAPEVQESTIAAKNLTEADKGTDKHTATKISIISDHINDIAELAKEHGLQFTANEAKGTIDFLDFGKGGDLEFNDKFTNFAHKLKENGTEHRTKATPIESRFITSRNEEDESSDREGIFKNIERRVGLQPGGQVLRDVITEAKKRNEEFIRQQSLEKERKEHAELRDKQIKLQQEEKELSDKELNRLTELIDKLLPHTEKTFENARENYEQAKKEIEATGKEVAESVGGFLSTFNIKNIARAAVKTFRWYKGKAHWLGDGARTNIIVPSKKDVEPAVRKLQEAYEGGLTRNDLDDTELGYPKKLVEVRTSNGTIAEFQVMTPEGYLAKDGVKEFPDTHKEDAKKQLEAVQQKVGWKIPDGVGHYFYEINRDLNVPKKLREKAKELSVRYYDAFLNGSKISEKDFRDDVQAFKDEVDAADKTKWDKGNKAIAPKTLQDFLKTEPSQGKVDVVKIGGQEFYRTENEKGKGIYTNKKDGVQLPENTQRYRDTEERFNPKIKKEETKVTQEEEEKPVKKAEKTSEELIDEEPLEIQSGDDKETVHRLNGDIEAMRTYEKQGQLEAKFSGILKRAFKAKSEKKISRATFLEYKKKVKDILGGKMDKSRFDKEAILFKIDELTEAAKKALQAEGYKNVTLNGVDGGKLIDAIGDLVKRFVEAGFTVKEAIDKAMDLIKHHPAYKKLLSEGNLDEKNFEKEARDKFEPAQKEEKEAGEESGKKAVAKTLLESTESEGLKEAVKKNAEYKVKKMDPTEENVNSIISDADKKGQVESLENSVLDKESKIDPYLRGALAIALSKRRSEEYNDMEDGPEREAISKKFADLYDVAASSATLAGQTSNYVGKVAKVLFESDPNLVVKSIKEDVVKQVDKALKGKSKGLEKTAKDIEEIYSGKRQKLTTERKEKIQKKINDAWSRLRETKNKTNGPVKQSFAPITDEQVKILAEIASGYIELGIYNLETLAKKLKKDFKDFTGDRLSNEAVDKVFGEKHPAGGEIREVAKKLSEEKKAKLKAAAAEAMKLEPGTEAKQVADKVQQQLDKMAEEQYPKDKVTPEKGDVELAQTILRETIGNDKTLSDHGKQQLLTDVLTHLEEKGEMSTADFKTLYGNAVGVSKFGPEQEKSVRESLKVINNADKIAREGSKMIAEWKTAKEEGNKEKADELYKKIKDKTVEYLNAQTKAAYANREISRAYKQINPYSVIASNIQLNLLTTSSIVNNIVAYLPTAPIRFVNNSIASFIDLVRYKVAMTSLGEKMGLEKKRNFNRMKELGLGYQIGFINGLKKAGISMAKGSIDESYTERNTNYEYNAPQKFIDAYNNMTDKQQRDYVKALKNVTEGILTISPDMMSRLLTWGDLPVKEKNRIAAAIGVAEQEGLEGAEMFNLIFNPTQEQSDKIKYEGEKASYQNPNFASKAIDKTVGNWIKSMEEDGGYAYHVAGAIRILRASILPYVKTPGNLVDDLLEHIVPPYAILRATLHAKNGNKREAYRSIAKMATGTAIATIATKMIMAGMLMPTSGEEEKKEKDIEYTTQRPGTMNLSALMRYMSGEKGWDVKRDDDTWVNYEKLGVPGMFMGTMANYYDRQENDGVNVKESNLLTSMLGATPTVASTALNNSFLQRLNEINEAINDKTGQKQNRLYTGEVGSLLAAIYPNWIATASLSGQDLVKDRKTLKTFNEQLAFDLKQKFFSGDDLPNKIDVFGRPVTRTPDGENKYVYYMLNPTKSYHVDKNTPEYKLFDFLQSIPKDEDNRLNVIPSQPKNEINGKSLSGNNYEEYQKLVGKYRYQILRLYTSSPAWAEDSKDVKEEYLKKAWKLGAEAGKNEFINSHAEFKKPEEAEDAEDLSTENESRPVIEEILPEKE